MRFIGGGKGRLRNLETGWLEVEAVDVSRLAKIRRVWPRTVVIKVPAARPTFPGDFPKRTPSREYAREKLIRSVRIGVGRMRADRCR